MEMADQLVDQGFAEEGYQFVNIDVSLLISAGVLDSCFSVNHTHTQQQQKQQKQQQ